MHASEVRTNLRAVETAHALQYLVRAMHRWDKDAIRTTIQGWRRGARHGRHAKEVKAELGVLLEYVRIAGITMIQRQSIEHGASLLYHALEGHLGMRMHMLLGSWCRQACRAQVPHHIVVHMTVRRVGALRALARRRGHSRMERIRRVVQWWSARASVIEAFGFEVG